MSYFSIKNSVGPSTEPRYNSTERRTAVIKYNAHFYPTDHAFWTESVTPIAIAVQHIREEITSKQH
jgi:hypothetical protein